MELPRILDNLIHQKRVPPIILIQVANGGGDAQGSQRGKEYDTTWTSYKVNAKAAAGAQVIDAYLKVWESKEAKLGLVKMEMTGKVTSAADPKNAVDTKMSLELAPPEAKPVEPKKE